MDTIEQTINPVVTQFLALLAQADSVNANSPLLSNWEALDATGMASNVVAVFTWEDSDGKYECELTEGAITDGVWTGNSFFCKDSKGDEVQISLYKHVPLTPTGSCKQCGSRLDNEGMCTDESCVFNDWPQSVCREDIKVFDVEEIETMYGVKKRS